MALDIPLECLAALRREVAFACNPAGTVIWADDSAVRLLGLRPGLALAAAMAPGSADKAARLVEAACGGDGQRWELIALAAGRPVVLAVRGIPYTAGALFVGSLEPEDARNQLEQVHAALADLAALHRESARREQEVARLYAEARHARAEAEAAVRLRNRFLAVVAHDLKDPLAATKYLLHVLRRDAERAAEADSLAIIEMQVDAMRRLVNQLLDAAQLEVGQELTLQCTTVDLQALVEQVVEQQGALDHTHRIQLEGAGRGALIGYWDPDRLERVVANLLSNASRYSAQDTPIVVQLARADDAAGAWALLSVTDQGVGIPAADLPHIFEQYYRASNVAARVPGMGIGLAGARHIVERHGGTIAVESTEGFGTAFHVRLPLPDPSAST